jgi:hypothetical protein
VYFGGVHGCGDDEAAAEKGTEHAQHLARGEVDDEDTGDVECGGELGDEGTGGKTTRRRKSQRATRALTGTSDVSEHGDGVPP